ncbi:cell division protein SepF [Nocardia sp. alder85J]|uniref:cell division protein SepF n=1 Tax=Nocardia sp. alder85J TaxID=2862949 RepID=UPI001CD1A263|nr:cell division protein SepF [Nocardia sp. alder85J]MCX4095230.1 cell division protein SepF [Nocardia sp. alder85J]
MSTLHRFKAYFGMVPLEEYEDDYVDDRAPRSVDERGPRSADGPRSVDERGPRRVREYGDARYEAAGRAARYGDESGYAESTYQDAYQPGYTGARREFGDESYAGDRYDAARRPARVEAVPAARSGRPATDRPGGGAPVVRGTTHGALAVDPEAERRLEERRLEERARYEPAPRRSPAFVEEGGPLSKITTLRPRTYAEAAIIGERFRDGTPVIMDLVEMSNADARRLVDFAAGLAFALRGSFDKVATKVFLLSPADVDVSAEERRRIAETGFYNQK